MSDTTKEQILDFVRACYPQAEIDETQDIFALGFVNSLFAMELVMFIEKTFEVTIPNDELKIDNFRSANTMAELVDRLSPRESDMTTLAETAPGTLQVTDRKSARTFVDTHIVPYADAYDRQGPGPGGACWSG